MWVNARAHATIGCEHARECDTLRLCAEAAVGAVALALATLSSSSFVSGTYNLLCIFILLPLIKRNYSIYIVVWVKVPVPRHFRHLCTIMIMRAYNRVQL